jgi:hypothetical protein
MIREFFFVSGIGIGLFCGARRFILQRSKVNSQFSLISAIVSIV